MAKKTDEYNRNEEDIKELLHEMELMRARHEKDFLELHQIKPKVEDLEVKLEHAEEDKRCLGIKVQELTRRISEQGIVKQLIN